MCVRVCRLWHAHREENTPHALGFDGTFHVCLRFIPSVVSCTGNPVSILRPLHGPRPGRIRPGVATTTATVSVVGPSLTFSLSGHGPRSHAGFSFSTFSAGFSFVLLRDMGRRALSTPLTPLHSSLSFWPSLCFAFFVIIPLL